MFVRAAYYICVHSFTCAGVCIGIIGSKLIFCLYDELLCRRKSWSVQIIVHENTVIKYQLLQLIFTVILAGNYICRIYGVLVCNLADINA